MTEEDADLLAQAMHCADTGDATHWPTVAGILHDEIVRLREINARLEGLAFDSKAVGA
jgi:hypothetical protein